MEEHKNPFPGPQGGIVANNDHSKKIEDVNHFVIVDNPHFHRISALTVALSEMQEFGTAYSKQVVLNTKCLANELFNLGFPIKYEEFSFTESHMFVVELKEEYLMLVKSLEKSNIMLDSAGRIGCAEMTRIGMKPKEMKIIANFIFRALNNEEPTSLLKDVLNLVSGFQKTHYSY